MQTRTAKTIFLSALTAAVFFVAYSSCTEKQGRDFFTQRTQTLEKVETRTARKDEIESTNENKKSEHNKRSSETKTKQVLSTADEKNFQESVKSVFQHSKKFMGEQGRKSTYRFLKDLGVSPSALINQYTGEMTIEGMQANNGMMFFRAKFDSENQPVYLTFEVEKFPGAYEEVVTSLKDNVLGADAKPCFQFEDEAIAYQKDNFLIQVHKLNKSDIEMGHPNIPRVEEHIGNVQIVIEQDIHPDVCGKNITSVSEIEDNYSHEHE